MTSRGRREEAEKERNVANQKREEAEKERTESQKKAQVAEKEGRGGTHPP